MARRGQFEREHEPAQFAARRARAHRHRLGARERCEQERDVVDAVCVERAVATARLHADRERRAVHRQLSEFTRDRLAQCVCGRAARLGEPFRRTQRRFGERVAFGAQLGEPFG